MMNAKRITISEENNNIKIENIKPIKIITWHERNKQLIEQELLSREGKATKLKEDGKIISA